jgi:hypothetical protein
MAVKIEIKESQFNFFLKTGENRLYVHSAFLISGGDAMHPACCDVVERGVITGFLKPGTNREPEIFLAQILMDGNIFLPVFWKPQSICLDQKSNCFHHIKAVFSASQT